MTRGKVTTASRSQTASAYLITGLLLFLLEVFMLSRFNLSLLFSDTILTGGDSASWYQVLHTLKNEFLPHGKLFSYSISNFFGYLEGQHYFPLPFLAAAIAGFFMPLTVSLKVATVAGGFALPLTSFVAAYSIQKSRKTTLIAALLSGILAAGGSLVFLFNESYTIFGGNWLSTFAGEFCYSWAIALLPLFIASVILDQLKNRSGILSGILLGLIGLSHLFVFMPAFFLPFFPVFKLFFELVRGVKKENPESRQEKNLRLMRILTTYGIAFLLMAFWMLPMLATRKWAQPISMIWHFSSFKEFMRQTLALVWLPALIVFLAGSIQRNQKKRQRDLKISTNIGKMDKVFFSRFFAYAMASCVFLFLAAPGLGMPDIRFVPSALMFSLLGASLLVSNMALRSAKRLSLQESSPGSSSKRTITAASSLMLAEVAVALVSCSTVLLIGKNAPGWFAWNYSGYEAKQEWSFINKLRDSYQGSIDDGRLLWEKQDQRDNRDFGSERAFENLYLFTGHPSSEGIHYGSSFIARAATYLQSSYSLHPVDPEAERIYSAIDPDSWAPRFAQLNVNSIIVHSDEMKKLFSAHPSFELAFDAGKFSVYRFKAYTGHSVHILPASALSIVKPGPGGFKTDYYRFFRDYELIRFPFISGEFADSHLVNALNKTLREFLNYDQYRAAMLPQALIYEFGTESQQKKEALPSVSDEHIDNFSISFHTEFPGQPHVIALSHAPGWKSLNGEKIYPISPGFMLIIPTTKDVKISYQRTTWEWLGLLLTLSVIPFAYVIQRRFRGARNKWQSSRMSWKILTITGMTIFLISVAALSLNTAAGYPALVRDIHKARSLNIGQPDQRKQALTLTEKWATTENLGIYDNMLVFDAFRIKARVLEREGKTLEAQALYDTLKFWYPHTRAAESLP